MESLQAGVRALWRGVASAAPGADAQAPSWRDAAAFGLFFQRGRGASPATLWCVPTALPSGGVLGGNQCRASLLHKQHKQHKGGFFLPASKSGTSAVRPSASTKIDAVFTQLASHPVPSTLCSGRSHRVDVLRAAPPARSRGWRQPRRMRDELLWRDATSQSTPPSQMAATLLLELDTTSET